MQIISDNLFSSSRPGYPSESGITQGDVDRWVDEVKNGGVVSIICLLHPDDKHLGFYTDLPGGGLLEYYRKCGFNVVHIPYKDHQSPLLSKRCMEDVYEAYMRLPKPVLIHCSAGIGRTGAAVEYLQSRINNSEGR